MIKAVLAAFELIPLPLANFWGAVVFGDWPDAVSWFEITLTMIRGLYMFWRAALSPLGGLVRGPHQDRQPSDYPISIGCATAID